MFFLCDSIYGWQVEWSDEPHGPVSPHLSVVGHGLTVGAVTRLADYFDRIGYRRTIRLPGY